MIFFSLIFFNITKAMISRNCDQISEYFFEFMWFLWCNNEMLWLIWMQTSITQAMSWCFSRCTACMWTPESSSGSDEFPLRIMSTIIYIDISRGEGFLRF